MFLSKLFLIDFAIFRFLQLFIHATSKFVLRVIENDSPVSDFKIFKLYRNGFVNNVMYTADKLFILNVSEFIQKY